MKKLVFLALASLLALAALWRLLQDERGDGRPRGTSSAGEPAAETAERPRPAVELDSVPAPASAERTEVARHLEPGSGPPSVYSREHSSFPTEGARWIDVTVVLPAAVPPDDRPALLLFACSGDEMVDEGDIRRVSEALDLSDGFAGDLEEDLAWARRELASSVRMPCPATASAGFFLLQSRYLHLEPVEIDLAGSSAVTLEPELGGYVTGRCVLPPGAEERAIEAEDVEIEFDGRPREGGLAGFQDQDSRDVRVRDDLTFELRALSAQRKYSIQAEIEGLVGHFELAFEVGPLERRELELPFQLGASLSGSVRGDDGQPLAGASVSTRGRMGPPWGNANATSGATDERGLFQLQGVPAGKVTLHVQKDGWLEATGEPLQVVDGQSVRGLEFVLESGLRISGSVLWPDGAPAAGASVSARRLHNQGYREEVSETEADEEGRFALGGLEEGALDLVARCPADDERRQRFGLPPLPPELRQTGHSEIAEISMAGAELFRGSRDWNTAHWLGVAHGVEPGARDLVLQLSVPIAVPGTVVDDTGAPVVSFRIEARPAGQSEWGGEFCSRNFDDTDGSFALEVSYPGDWSFQAEAQGYTAGDEPVEFAVPPAGEPLRLVLSRAASISGRVVDPAGQAVAEATVTASSGAVGPWNREERSGQSDASGAFLLEKVPGSSASVVAEHEDWAASPPQALELAPGETSSGIVLQLRVGGRITGQVFDAEGEPRARQNVTCGIGGFGFDGEDTTLTDASGKFAFEHVTPGKVTVSALPSEEQLFELMSTAEDETAFVGLFSQMSTATVEVADGQEVHVILGAKPRVPVRVHGRVREAGEPLPESGIFAIAEGGALLQGMKVARTDADGRYDVVLDRPGDYVFTVDAEGLDGRGVPFYVEVPEVEELEQDFELPLGRLRGRVVGPDRAAAAGVAVRISRSGGLIGIDDLSESNRSVTASDGAFDFEHLHPGTYTLQVGGSSMPFDPSDQRFGAAIVSGIEIEEDRTVDDLEVRLFAPGKLAGAVRDERGNPVSGASVFVRDEAGRASSFSACTTDAAGRFTYSGIAPGRVTASARTGSLASADSEPLEIHAGETSTVELVLQTGSFLIVSLLDGDRPVRARLLVLDEQGRRVDDLVSLEDVQALFSQGFSSRERRIGPLPPGKYTATATAPDGKDAKKSVVVEPGQEERHVKLRLR